ncbi:MAG TPA: hypothetical protein VFO95_15230 [Gemmatimonadales bacterium]|nr:hypothetical protein [Gemmatimonadales bacterium]
MTSKSRILMYSALVLAGIAAPTVATAQANPGQVVQAVAKLNAAQLAFARKLASDGQFAQEFHAAASSGNDDAAAGMVANASGVAVGAVRVFTTDGGDDTEELSTGSQQVTMQLAGHRPARMTRKGALSINICFDFGSVKGCIKY